MKILITGAQSQRKELISTLPDTLDFEESNSVEGKNPEQYDCIFDLNIDNAPETIAHYKSMEKGLLVLGAVKYNLLGFKSRVALNENLSLIGLNTLNGFIDRSLKELSFLNERSKKAFENLNESLKWDFQTVEDRVGMVSPRVILMIINEACYTLQEGTADIPAIDQAMKLGTNYPKGPFEWADEIGVKDVYLTLKAVFEDTGDERYKICPLLKQYFLAGKNFYQ